MCVNVSSSAFHSTNSFRLPGNFFPRSASKHKMTRPDTRHLPFVVAMEQDPSLLPQTLSKTVRRGDPCPQCGQGKLDYNGLLELACDQCGYTLTGGAGCT